VEIDTGEGTAEAPNGLAAPAGVYGPDGKAAADVYAGDVLGNIWEVDLQAGTAKKLFAAGGTQPDRGGAAGSSDPGSGERGVLFGAGRYLLAEDANPVGAPKQSMYGFIDEDITVALTPEDLVDNTPSEWTTGTVEGMTVRAFKEKAPLPADARGWRV